MYEIKYQPIGIVHSPFKEPKGMPIQPTAAKNVKGTIEIFQKYEEGLMDLEGFSHIILIYHFHLSKGFNMTAKPFMENKLHGIFAIRGPNRPNPIGMSAVRLIKVKKNILYIEDVDLVDGTPLLDIKPYVPEFDVRDVEKIGWLKKNIYKLSDTKNDERFLK